MKKMLIQSSILLLIGGFITKLLGMLIKIIMSRNLGIDGISLYMLTLPTFSFCILLGQAGLPFTLSRMVAYHDKPLSSLYVSTLVFLFFYNLLLCIVLILLAPFISHNLLKNDAAYLPIIGIALVIPFTTLSNTIKSYFIGIQKIFPTILSNISENTLRLLFVYWIIPLLKSNSQSYLVFLIILFNIVSELFATIILLLFLPKKKKTFSFQSSLLKETLYVSTPQLLSTLIGNGTYLLEPILFFHFLSEQFQTNYITQQYGIITGYVLPIIFLPLFFITTLSQALLPTITQLYRKNNISKIRKLLKFQNISILLFSIGTGTIFHLYAKTILQLIYHTVYGIQYLKFLSFFLFFLFLEPTFQYLWIAFGKTKEIFKGTLFSSIIRILSLLVFLQLEFGIYSLLLSFVINIILTTLYQNHRIVYYIKKRG